MSEALPSEWRDRPTDPPSEFQVPVVEVAELQNGLVLQSKRVGEFIYAREAYVNTADVA